MTLIPEDEWHPLFNKGYRAGYNVGEADERKRCAAYVRSLELSPGLEAIAKAIEQGPEAINED